MSIEKFKVIRIEKYGVFSVSKHGDQGFLHISEVSDFFIKNLNVYFTVGQEYNFLVKEFCPQTRRYILNYKNLNLSLKHYRRIDKIIETEQGFAPLDTLIKQFQTNDEYSYERDK